MRTDAGNYLTAVDEFCHNRLMGRTFCQHRQRGLFFSVLFYIRVGRIFVSKFNQLCDRGSLEQLDELVSVRMKAFFGFI